MSAAKRSISVLGAGLLAIGIAAGASAQTPEPAEPPKDALDEIQKSVVSAIERGLQLLSVAVGQVLPYKLPEILPNGDIIIRYVPPAPPEAPPAETKPDTKPEPEPAESQKI